MSVCVRSFVSARTRSVPRKLFSSGTGWPASMHSTPSTGPITWPYLVTQTPPAMGVFRQSTAARVICQAALPAAARKTRPGNSIPARARSTALSGSTAAMAERTMVSASRRNISFMVIPPVYFLNY